jgi:hypothetical protein
MVDGKVVQPAGQRHGDDGGGMLTKKKVFASQAKVTNAPNDDTPPRVSIAPWALSLEPNPCERLFLTSRLLCSALLCSVCLSVCLLCLSVCLLCLTVVSVLQVARAQQEGKLSSYKRGAAMYKAAEAARLKRKQQAAEGQRLLGLQRQRERDTKVDAVSRSRAQVGGSRAWAAAAVQIDERMHARSAHQQQQTFGCGGNHGTAAEKRLRAQQQRRGGGQGTGEDAFGGDAFAGGRGGRFTNGTEQSGAVARHGRSAAAKWQQQQQQQQQRSQRADGPPTHSDERPVKRSKNDRAGSSSAASVGVEATGKEVSLSELSGDDVDEFELDLV